MTPKHHNCHLIRQGLTCTFLNLNPTRNAMHHCLSSVVVAATPSPLLDPLGTAGQRNPFAKPDLWLSPPLKHRQRRVGEDLPGQDGTAQSHLRGRRPH